eukprot:TRINITY_DN1555_c0_g2_i4.p1 TRINITY_DN1555_c0_g2~~TRINITY_DN1555_c0_g2_i4.p1  ORF type:complete len:219 (-),score=41.63 TRINITY_DN1555_c0_g2_i4:581-1237(-)
MACNLDFLKTSSLHSTTSARGNKLWADMTPTPTQEDASPSFRLPMVGSLSAPGGDRRRIMRWADDSDSDTMSTAYEFETSTDVSTEDLDSIGFGRTISQESGWSRQYSSFSVTSEKEGNSDASARSADRAKPSSSGLQKPAAVTAGSNTGASWSSVGSMEHHLGNCKPCAWFYKRQGCQNGVECRHCHACPKGEIRRRKKDRLNKSKAEQKEAESDSE